MKKIKIISLFTLNVIVIFTLFYSCNQQEIEALSAKAAFTLNPAQPYVGEPFTITFEQENEFITVYFGDSLGNISRDFNDYPNSEGVVVTGLSAEMNSDTTMYSKPGVYTITVVARNYGQWTSEYEEDILTKEVTITDRRAAFKKFGFSFSGAFYFVGSITDDTIFVRVPEQRDLSNVVVDFSTSASVAKVYVGEIEQVSGSTRNDFSNPLRYRIEASDGTEKEYIVATKKYFGDTATSLNSLGFILSSSAVSTTYTDTVDISLPWGYSVSSSEPVLWSIPDYSELYIDGVYQGNNYVSASTGIANFSSGCTLKVEAESGDTAIYHSKTSFRSPVLSFGFPDLVPEIVGVINDTVITCDILVPPSAPDLLTLLTPVFSEGEGKASVMIGDVSIKDSDKVVDFTAAADSFQIMNIIGMDGTSVKYTIIINKH